jgi:heme exporter protein A
MSLNPSGAAVSVLSLHLDARVATGIANAVQAVGLCKSIDDRAVLQDVTLSIAPGRAVALLGANGAGKSTLLKVLATLTPPTAGKLAILGHAVESNSAALRARIGLIGHQSMLYRDLSARQNLEFFGRLYGLADPKRRAADLLDATGLGGRADDPVKGFSRGMTQRVAIARALVHDPELLLADEPFDGLDAPSIALLEQTLAELHRSGKTLILANHDISQSLRLTEQTVVLREGRVVIDQPSKDLEAAAVLAEMERL